MKKYETFEVGQLVILDKEFSNTSLVYIVSQTPNCMFTTVESEGVKWEVITDRLSKK